MVSLFPLHFEPVYTPLAYKTRLYFPVKDLEGT